MVTTTTVFFLFFLSNVGTCVFKKKKGSELDTLLIMSLSKIELEIMYIVMSTDGFSVK